LYADFLECVQQTSFAVIFGEGLDANTKPIDKSQSISEAQPASTREKPHVVSHCPERFSKAVFGPLAKQQLIDEIRRWESKSFQCQ
jgi:hypothetical protein